MRILIFLLGLAVFIAGVSPAPARAGLDLGVSIGEKGLEGFYLAVGDYYGAPRRSVAVIQRRGLPDDEIPVAFFLAAQGGVDPMSIVSLRLGGKSWMAISLSLGLKADVFHPAVKTDPPYGKAYGHYMGKPKGQWKALRLSDAEVVNLVNLRFISEHYGLSPDEAIRMREEGRSFVAIHEKAKKAKGRKTEGSGERPARKGKGKGKKEKDK